MRHSCWRRLLLRLQEPRPLTGSAARSVSYVTMVVAACGATHSAVTSSLTIRSSRCRFAARLNSSVRRHHHHHRSHRYDHLSVLPQTSNVATQEIIFGSSAICSVQIMLQARFRPSGRNVGGHAIPLQHHPCTLSGSAWLAVQRFILVCRHLGNGCNTRVPRPTGAA